MRANISRTSGVEIRCADAADSDSLRTAFDGATQLFLTMSDSPDQVALETRVIDGAAASGIAHIVELSAPTAAPDSSVAIARWHDEIEQVLRASGIAHTPLRPYAFMQKLALLGREVARRGAIVGTMGSAVCNYIDCRDIADVAAAAPGPKSPGAHTPSPDPGPSGTRSWRAC